MTMPVVRVSGGPRERGRALGETLADPINRSIAFLRRFLERRGIGVGDLPALLASSRQALARWRPSLLAEIDGTAEGAGVAGWELFAANAFEELEAVLPVSARIERCTAFAVTDPEGTILAHNEQWYAADVGNSAVVVAEPDLGPAFAAPTVAPFLPAVGMNAHGLAQGVMSLTHRDDGEGIPRVPVSRYALQARTFEDHHARVTPPGRSGGYAYVVAAAGGEAHTVETTATAIAPLVNEAAHTNHYLAPPLAEAGSSSTGSESRLDRLRALLAEWDPRTPEQAMAILADHQGQPEPICVHPDPADEESAAIVFAMVCQIEQRRMWVSAGNPCEVPFEEIVLGVAA
jgi:isopenicillin-N N-acyltransferase-like protein